MRILPILFYIQAIYGADFQEREEIFEIIHNVSSLTHGHKRSLMACGIYISIASKLIVGKDLGFSVLSGIYSAMEYYKRYDEFQSELKYFTRLEDKHFKDLPVEEIKSGGYVVDTLEAAIWCLLNTNDYKSCVLKAVNLGNDTDTTGAVVGGLAGLRYGYENIPSEWIDIIARKEYIEDVCDNLYLLLDKSGLEKLI